MRSAREISTISTGCLEHRFERIRRSAHMGIYFMYTRVRVDLLRVHLRGRGTQTGNAAILRLIGKRSLCHDYSLPDPCRESAKRRNLAACRVQQLYRKEAKRG